MDDKEYVLAKGPWAVQGALIHFAAWRPNIRLPHVNVEYVPIWVQIWGLPLAYFVVDFAEYLGTIIGPVEWVDWPTGYPRNLRFLRV